MRFTERLSLSDFPEHQCSNAKNKTEIKFTEFGKELSKTAWTRRFRRIVAERKEFDFAKKGSVLLFFSKICHLSELQRNKPFQDDSVLCCFTKKCGRLRP